MRLSVCIPMFFAEIGLCEAIQKIAELGYDACEAWNINDEAELKDAAAACKKHDVEFLAICTDCFNCTGGDEKAYLNGIRSAAEKAKVLGAKILISQVGADTGAPKAQQHANVVKCLRAATPFLEKEGLTLVIEPLSRGAEQPAFFLSSSAEAFEIIKEVNSPHVKVLFDIYHQQKTEGNLIANITQNISFIGHLHAAGCPNRNELNKGEVNYTEIFSAIDATGYEGVCTLEYVPSLSPEESLQLTKKLYQ